MIQQKVDILIVLMFSRLFKASIGLAALGLSKIQCSTSPFAYSQNPRNFYSTSAQDFMFKISAYPKKYMFYLYQNYPPQTMYQCSVIIDMIFKTEEIRVVAFRLTFETCQVVVQLPDKTYYILHLKNQLFDSIINEIQGKVTNGVYVNEIKEIGFQELVRILFGDPTYKTE